MINGLILVLTFDRHVACHALIELDGCRLGLSLMNADLRASGRRTGRRRTS
jgi:hypothetical protein